MHKHGLEGDSQQVGLKYRDGPREHLYIELPIYRFRLDKGEMPLDSI